MGQIIPPPPPSEPCTPPASGAEIGSEGEARRCSRLALLGNPNTGKTTLFNRLSGLRHKTSNFPGTTLDARIGRITVGSPGGPQESDRRSVRAHSQSRQAELIDLPGIYSLELDQLESEVCRAVLAGRTAPRGQKVAEPDGICIVVDATNLGRNLMLVGEALRRRLPTVVAINMIDLSRRRGIAINPAVLAEQLGCPVVCISARTGEGLAELSLALEAPRIPNRTPPGESAGEQGLRAWADELGAMACSASGAGRAAAGGAAFPSGFEETWSDRADRVLTHPVMGVAAFALIMCGLFWALFSIAQYPMEWIDALFALAAGGIQNIMPEGLLRELVAGGIITGIGATVIFLPQICLLFFLISLLEDTGYLARAAFVVDRLLRPFGLPGHAFVPLLSAHACALPGIMATRAIPDPRERLATILVAPFMACSARLPVYVLLVGLLFGDRPFVAALAFVGCYLVGIGAGMFSALVARKTILRGPSRPMALELPSYKLPSIRTALLTSLDRGRMFLAKAGTNILAICIVLWWLGAFPYVQPPAAALELEQRAALVEPASPLEAEELRSEASRLTAMHAQANSFAGRLGRTIQPVLAPLGFDWQLSVGVLTSFAAREVFVSTMAVIVAGEDAGGEGVLEKVGNARRDDGTPLFTPAVCWSLLIYYILAMQCLPTLAVTAREAVGVGGAGGLKWALLQLAWMSGLAYIASMVVFQVLG
jgi:ferrous iron transport protein B